MAAVRKEKKGDSPRRRAQALRVLGYLPGTFPERAATTKYHPQCYLQYFTSHVYCTRHSNYLLYNVRKRTAQIKQAGSSPFPVLNK